MFDSHNICDGASGAKKKMRQRNEDFRNALNLYFIKLEVELFEKLPRGMNGEWPRIFQTEY